MAQRGHPLILPHRMPRGNEDTCSTKLPLLSPQLPEATLDYKSAQFRSCSATNLPVLTASSQKLLQVLHLYHKVATSQLRVLPVYNKVAISESLPLLVASSDPPLETHNRQNGHLFVHRLTFKHAFCARLLKS